jgi:hypothetical protein
LQATIQKVLPNRLDFIDNFTDYSDTFLERLKDIGCTELNEPLKLYPWLEELASGISDLRIYHVATTGNAQCGKSLINTLFLCDFFLNSNLDCIWFYPTKTQLDNLVPNMFGRVMQNYETRLIERVKRITGEKTFSLRKTTDKENNNIFQRRGSSIYFRYASTSGRDNTPQGKGLAGVGGSASSISGEIIFVDERSQIQPDALSMLFRRTDAARLAGGLIREIGTPGNGLGIELLLESSEFHFYPHIKCQNCSNEIQLSPKGCLLKKDKTGKFLSVTGRPINWFFKNSANKVKSAYIACSICGVEIADIERERAFFKCLKTGKRFTEFKKELPIEKQHIFKDRKIIAFHLSPLLRQTKVNLANHLIKTGLITDSTRDYQQQVLGFPSESETVRITREMIKSAMGKYEPTEPHTCIVAGIDQGRRQDWLVIYKCWVKGFKRLNKHVCTYEMSTEESPVIRIENATREVIYIGEIERKNIPYLMNKYNVDLGFMDAEPGIAGAYEMSKNTCLLLADQKRQTSKLVQEMQFYDGALAVPGFGLHTLYFQDMLVNAYASECVCLPELDLYDKSPSSAVRHLIAPEKDLENNKWIRPQDKNDDLFFASMFAEAALHHWCNIQVEKSVGSVDWYRNLQ